MYYVIMEPYILMELYNLRHPSPLQIHQKFLVQIYQVKFNVKMAGQFK